MSTTTMVSPRAKGVGWRVRAGYSTCCPLRVSRTLPGVGGVAGEFDGAGGANQVVGGDQAVGGALFQVSEYPVEAPAGDESGEEGTDEGGEKGFAGEGED
jgi:hypothetical protein